MRKKTSRIYFFGILTVSFETLHEMKLDNSICFDNVLNFLVKNKIITKQQMLDNKKTNVQKKILTEELELVANPMKWKVGNKKNRRI